MAMDNIRSIITIIFGCCSFLTTAFSVEAQPAPPLVLDQLSEYKGWAERLKRSDLESIEIRLTELSVVAFWSVGPTGRSLAHVYIFNRRHTNWEFAEVVNPTGDDRLANALYNRQDKTLLFENQNGHLVCSIRLTDAERLINGGTPVGGPSKTGQAAESK